MKWPGGAAARKRLEKVQTSLKHITKERRDEKRQRASDRV